jgi:Transposase DDE domain
MRRTAIRPARMYELAREFLAAKKVVIHHEKGGRPRDYDDALILTIACIQNLHQFSFREALEFCGDIFPELPTLSTYHYRLSKISPKIAQGFVAHLGKKIQKENQTQEGASKRTRFFVTDGTGFSFHDVYPMKLHLGTEIRKIAAHVKIVVLVGIFGANRRFVISANAGRPYAAETKLVAPLLNDLDPSYGYLVADKGYDSHDVIAAGMAKGLKPAIAIKQGRLRKKINDPLRLISKKNADNPKVYRKRTLVEGMFGNVKQKLSSHIKIFRLDIAQTFALLRFALFNMAILVSLEQALIWLWFSNSLTCSQFSRLKLSPGDDIIL